MTVLSGDNFRSREIFLNRSGLIRELVAANRILSAEGGVDAFGQVSARLPTSRVSRICMWTTPRYWNPGSWTTQATIHLGSPSPSA
jgi:hypothetical protein